jgi:hypothetical protein
MPQTKLKLYVWTNVLCDYTSRIAFAIARDRDEAALPASQGYWRLNGDPWEAARGYPIQELMDAKPDEYEIQPIAPEFTMVVKSEKGRDS